MNITIRELVSKLEDIKEALGYSEYYNYCNKKIDEIIEAVKEAEV